MFIKKYFLVILVFCLALGIRLYAISQKTFVYHDDPITFVSSSPTKKLPNGAVFKTSWWRFSVPNGEYNVKDLKKSFFGNDANPKEVLKDLWSLHQGNIEIEHTSLYYYIVRVWNLGVDGTNPDKCMKRGLYLNIMFFIMEFFFLYKLLNLIKPDDTKFASIGLFFAFLNTATISNTLLIREYALAQMCFVWGTYIAYLIAVKNEYTKKEMLYYSFVFCMVAMSNYMLILYDGLLALSLIIYKVIKKQELKNLLLIILLFFLWIFLLYPKYFVTFLINHYTDSVYDNMKHLQFHSFDYYSFLFYKCIILPVLLVWIFVSKKIVKPLAFVILPALIWVLLIVWLIPLSNMRFIFPSMSIMALSFLLVLYYFKNLYVIVIAGFYFILTLMPVINPYFTYTKTDYLYDDVEMYEPTIIKPYKLNPEYPVVVYNSPYQTWYYTLWYFDKLGNDGKIIFVDKIPDENFEYKKFYLFLVLEQQNDEYIKKLCTVNMEDIKYFYIEIFNLCFIELK